MFNLIRDKQVMPDAASAATGRGQAIPTAKHHFVNGNSLHEPYPDGMQKILFGMGCFWGAERIFWNLSGVYVTAVGYTAGLTPNPTYEEVCSGLTGHNEVVLVVFNPEILPLGELLQLFWENHDPTQAMRQGNDRGTQYRSGIYAYNQGHIDCAIASKETYQMALTAARYPSVTSEILKAPQFYFAEEYHQQYLEKNPSGYCGIGGTGVACSVGLDIEAGVDL